MPDDLDVPGEVVMFRVADRVVLSLWSERGFEDEVGPIRRGSGLAPITLSHNLPKKEGVDAVLADAAAAGAHEVGSRMKGPLLPWPLNLSATSVICVFRPPDVRGCSAKRPGCS